MEGFTKWLQSDAALRQWCTHLVDTAAIGARTAHSAQHKAHGTQHTAHNTQHMWI